MEHTGASEMADGSLLNNLEASSSGSPLEKGEDSLVALVKGIDTIEKGRKVLDSNQVHLNQQIKEVPSSPTILSKAAYSVIERRDGSDENMPANNHRGGCLCMYKKSHIRKVQL